MQSKATTVAAYLKELPADRKPAIEAVRKVILAALPDGYEEGMSYGMIGYFVPHSVYPPGYHCNPALPLPFAGLASQKQHMSVYLSGVYEGGVGGESSARVKQFRDAWAKTGKKLDMGKCCIRFKKLDDLALDVIADAIRRMPVRDYVDGYERVLADLGIKHKGKKAAMIKSKEVAIKPSGTSRGKRAKPSNPRLATKTKKRSGKKVSVKSR
jgi:hypothetical protein